MSANPSLKSTDVEHSATNGDHQGGFVGRMADRVRSRAKELNFNATSFGTAIGIKSSAIANYWNGKRPFPTEALPQMAETLRTNVDFLLTGRIISAPVATDLVDVSKADWVGLPWFDLNNLTEETKGAIRETVPFRRDWLNRRILRSTGLWITELPSDYEAVGLNEGDAVICSDVSVSDLYANWICIFKGLNKPFVARYVGIASDADDVVVTDNDLATGELHPVARIHARILTKL